VGDQEIRLLAFEDSSEISEIPSQCVFANRDVEATERDIAVKTGGRAEAAIQGYNYVSQPRAKMICEGGKADLCAAGIEGRKNVEKERDHSRLRNIFTMSSAAYIATNTKSGGGSLSDYYYTHFYAQRERKHATMCICWPFS